MESTSWGGIFCLNFRAFEEAEIGDKQKFSIVFKLLDWSIRIRLSLLAKLVTSISNQSQLDFLTLHFRAFSSTVRMKEKNCMQI